MEEKKVKKETNENLEELARSLGERISKLEKTYGSIEFCCANPKCECNRTGHGISFMTDNIIEAERHSRENNSPMWVAYKGKV